MDPAAMEQLMKMMKAGGTEATLIRERLKAGGITEDMLKQMDELDPDGDSLRMMSLAASRRDKGPPPILSCRLPPRQLVMMAFDHATATYEKELAQRRQGDALTFQMRQTLNAPIVHGVAPALAGLTPMLLKDAVTRVNCIWTDRVLFATLIRPPTRAVGTTLMLEDLAGDVILLNAYNAVTDAEDPRAVFPVGTRLAILQPYLRHTGDDPEALLMLRCDNPQCLVTWEADLPPPEPGPWPKTWTGSKPTSSPSLSGAAVAERLCVQGTAAFTAGRDVAAARLYAAAAAADSTAAKYVANAAAANLRCGRAGAALAAAEAALALEPGHVKSRHRRATALLRLWRHGEARAVAEALAASLPPGDASAADVKTLITDCARCERESRGVVDVMALSAEAETAMGRRLRPHADFESPKIRVVPDAGGAKGRRVVAAAPIAPGELLMCARAWAYVGATGMDCLSAFGGSSSFVDQGSKARIVAAVIHELLCCPEKGESLYSLSGGKKYAPLAPGTPGIDRVDVARIAAIAHNNSHGVNGLTELERFLAEIRACAAKGVDQPTAAMRNELQSKATIDKGTGLFVRPSLMNHSCFPSAVYNTFGDVMLVVSTRHVAEDEEITVSYVDILRPYAERAATLGNWNEGEGFVCDCLRCADGRSGGTASALEAEIDAAFTSAASLLMAGRPARAAADAAMAPKRRRSARVALEAMPLPLRFPLLRLYELETGVLLASGDVVAAMAELRRAVALAAALLGDNGLSYPSLKLRLQLAAAAVDAGRLDDATEAMRAAHTMFCCPPWGLLSVDDLTALSDRYAVRTVAASDVRPALRRLIKKVAQAARA